MNTKNENNTMNTTSTMETQIKWELIKVGRCSVRKAKGFIWDECHRIYLVPNDASLRKLQAEGETIYSMVELEDIFNDSCPLRFINWYDDDLTTVVPQFARRVSFKYSNGVAEDVHTNFYC